MVLLGPFDCWNVGEFRYQCIQGGVFDSGRQLSQLIGRPSTHFEVWLKAAMQ
ncbi:MAG: hypothetical protein JXQ84_03255 [Rhodospirillaceae bacterium]|nr:hypothetical protein [Rhodospirillaceae bacterium]